MAPAESVHGLGAFAEGGKVKRPPFQPGYLRKGALWLSIPPENTEGTCIVCQKPMTLVNRLQKCCSPECSRTRRLMFMKRWNKRETARKRRMNDGNT